MELAAAPLPWGDFWHSGPLSRPIAQGTWPSTYCDAPLEPVCAFSGFEYSGKGMRDVRCMASTGACDTAARSASSAATAWQSEALSTQQGAVARCGVPTKSRLTGLALQQGVKQQHSPAQMAAPAMHHPINFYPPHSAVQAQTRRHSWQSPASTSPNDNVQALGSLGHRSKQHPSCSTPPASLPEANVPLLSTDMEEELHALQQVLLLPSTVDDLLVTHCDMLDDKFAASLKKRGKGGRNRAADARLDPNLDPKKASRIMSNRLSAARSKMKQRVAQQGLRAKLDMLTRQRDRLAAELATLKHMCRELEAGAP